MFWLLHDDGRRQSGPYTCGFLFGEVGRQTLQQVHQGVDVELAVDGLGPCVGVGEGVGEGGLEEGEACRVVSVCARWCLWGGRGGEGPCLAYLHLTPHSSPVVAIAVVLVGDESAGGDDREDEGLDSSSSVRWDSAPKLSEREWRMGVRDCGRDRERIGQERR